MEDENSQEQILKQNYWKAFLSKFLMVVFGAILIMGVAFFSDYMIGLDVLMTPLEVFNVNVDTSKILMQFIIGTIGVSFFLGVLNMVSVRSLKYIFYNDRVVIQTSTFFTSNKEIPFQNIIKVDSNKNGLFSSIFNSGTVILELNNMKQKQVKLEYIDNPLEVGNYIQTLVRNYMGAQQERINQGNNMQNTMNQL